MLSLENDIFAHQCKLGNLKRFREQKEKMEKNAYFSELEDIHKKVIRRYGVKKEEFDKHVSKLLDIVLKIQKPFVEEKELSSFWKRFYVDIEKYIIGLNKSNDKEKYKVVFHAKEYDDTYKEYISFINNYKTDWYRDNQYFYRFFPIYEKDFSENIHVELKYKDWRSWNTLDKEDIDGFRIKDVAKMKTDYYLSFSEVLDKISSKEPKKNYNCSCDSKLWNQNIITKVSGMFEKDNKTIKDMIDLYNSFTDDIEENYKNKIYELCFPVDNILLEMINNNVPINEKITSKDITRYNFIDSFNNDEYCYIHLSKILENDDSSVYKINLNGSILFITIDVDNNNVIYTFKENNTELTTEKVDYVINKYKDKLIDSYKKIYNMSSDKLLNRAEEIKKSYLDLVKSYSSVSLLNGVDLEFDYEDGLFINLYYNNELLDRIDNRMLENPNLKKILSYKIAEETFDNFSESLNFIVSRYDDSKVNEIIIESQEEKERSRELKEIDKRLSILDTEINNLLKTREEIVAEKEKLSKDIINKPGKIKVTNEFLFEQVEDHKVIKDNLIPYLKWFDYSNISWKNVDMRGKDFSNLSYSNHFTFNPEDVYLKSLYKFNCSVDEFTNLNYPFYKDTSFKGVDLRGANIDCKGILPNMKIDLNLEGAIIDDTTILPDNVNDKLKREKENQQKTSKEYIKSYYKKKETITTELKD